MDKQPVILKINKKERSAQVRYKNATVTAIFHEDGEMDWENFECLSERDFNDLTLWVIESPELEKAFPCPY